MIIIIININYQYFFLVIENDQDIKIIDANSNINSLMINGQTNLTFNLRPKKNIDR